HEMAVRLALGASAVSIVMHSLAESGTIALLGGLLGAAASVWSRGILLQIIPTEALPLSLPVAIDARVSLFAVATTALVAIGSGVIPALRATRVMPSNALRAGGRSLVGGSSMTRSAIVAGQIAVSLACLALASMFIDALRTASRVELGFRDPEHVLVVTTNLTPAHLADTAAENAIGEIIRRAAALPGVRSATVSSYVPLGLGGRPVENFKIDGLSPMPNQDMSAIRIAAGPNYATLMETRLVAGRDFMAGDRAGSRPVAMINETFAKRFFPGRIALGKLIDGGRGWATVVGVLADGKYGALTEHAQAVAYFPIAQWYQPSFHVFVRTVGDPLALAEPVRRVLQSVHIDIPSLQPRTLAEHISGATFVQRTGASVLTGFGIAALALSLVGLYGTLATAISQRRRELGVRLTLGATRASIVWLVLRQGLVIAAVGVSLGIPTAWVFARILHRSFDSISGLNGAGLAAGAVIVFAAATLAALTPARRALTVDPMEAMRAET